MIQEFSKKEMADAKTFARKMMIVQLGDKDDKKKDEEEVCIDVVGHLIGIS